MSTFDRFRKTFENLSSSFTEEVNFTQDKSDQSKSELTSEKSCYDNSYAVQFNPTHKSTDWVSDPDSTSYPGDQYFNQAYLSRLTQMQESLYIEIETLQNEKKILINENTHLRVKIQDLEKQLESQAEKLQKKEKELNCLTFEKELFAKYEEESSRLIEDLKKKCEFFHKENIEIKQNLENAKAEKRDLMRCLKEFELKNESFQRSIKVKEDVICTLEQTVEDLERSRMKIKPEYLSQYFKAQTGKFRISKLDLPEKRVVSESPERKSLQTYDKDKDEIFKILFSEVKKMLNANNADEVRDKIARLKEVFLKFKKTQKFISKLSNMIVQISPSGSFGSEPSTRQIWKWLTRLLEEYMKLKQSISGDGFNKLCSLLNTSSVEEMVERVIMLQKVRSNRNA